MQVLNVVVLLIGMFVSLECWGQRANFRQAERFRKAKECVGSLKVEPHFLEGGDSFWYSYQTSDGLKWYFVNPEKKIHKLLFDSELMAQKMTQLTQKPYSDRLLKINNLKVDGRGEKLRFTLNGFYYEYNLLRGELLKMDSVKFRKKIRPWATYSPDSSYLCYAQKHNLYMMKCTEGDSSVVQLTFNGEKYNSYAVNGKDTTSKKIKANIVWFKDSKKFYVLRHDTRKMRNLWLVNVMGGRPKLEEYQYAMPGDGEVGRYELEIFDLESNKNIKIKTEKWCDQELKVLYASKDSDRIYFERKKRTCDEIEICVANTITGECKVLINERAEPYLNEQLHNITILDDGKDLIWWSERTGWGHYYHYDGDGNLQNVISSGSWVAGKILSIDTLQRTLYFEGYGREKGRNPYYAHLYKASLDKEGVELLSPENAHHSFVFSKSTKYIVDNYSRVDLEPRSVVRNRHGKVILELSSPDLKRLYEMGWKMPECFTVKAADGVTDLYGVMWKPVDLDTTRQYPIISYVYPGPQTEAIPLGFTVDGTYNNALAQVGFIVVCFGHRGGSPMRDKWYHTYGYGNLRDYPLADDKYGIEQLMDRYSYIKRDKVGIYGHSGGGFMSTAALCTYPDFYTAAVSSSGNHDNNMYNKWWVETHHGVRELQKIVEDSVGNKRSISVFKSKVSTNLELAKKLKGYLLLVTGDMDNNVHPGHTLRMVDALMSAGKNFELVILPGQRHNYYLGAEEFYQRKMWFHFAKYLLDDFSSEKFYEIEGFNVK